jgi:signal transduction histidine kinase
LDNLISNALKYSPKERRIRTVVARETGWGTFSVIDEGPGFTLEDKKKVFGRFSKLSAQPTGGESSVGLGLSIVKHMVEAMGGQIILESEEGAGSTFKVRMPIFSSTP